MKFSILNCSLFALLFIAACTDEDSSLQTTDTAVVEAYLFAGQSLDTVKIFQSTSYASDDSTRIPLDGLLVALSDGTDTFQLESVGEGLYQGLDFQIQSGRSYALAFAYNQSTVSAETYVPTLKEATASTSEITMSKIEAGTFPNFDEMPDPIELEWDNTEGDYFYVVVQNIEDDPEVINELFEDEGRGFRFISEPQITDFYVIEPRREIQQFGMHRIVIFRVNPEYAALYETSSTTSTTITQPPSNVVNGLGLFTGVSSDTLFLNVKKG
ncbi:MAG: DUF4249 family protein [Phaeodactylibacter sp.]|nr:DUF4249 family protein [Phaeodactylibacter sp.]